MAHVGQKARFACIGFFGLAGGLAQLGIEYLQGGIGLHLAVVPDPESNGCDQQQQQLCGCEPQNGVVLLNDGGLFVFDQARDDGCGGQTQCLDIRPQSVHVGSQSHQGWQIQRLLLQQGIGFAQPVIKHRHQARIFGARLEQLDAGVVLQQVFAADQDVEAQHQVVNGLRIGAQLHPVQGVSEPQKLALKLEGEGGDGVGPQPGMLGQLLPLANLQKQQARHQSRQRGCAQSQPRGKTPPNNGFGQRVWGH